jgi:dUTP pyrophosphatase
MKVKFKKIPIKIKKIYPDAIIPKYQSNEAAGFDVHSLEDVYIHPKEQHIISTGLSFCLPKGWELQIRPRSGLAAIHCISITNSPGTLDSDYQGELKIILINFSVDKVYYVEKYDRIAQCVLSPVYQAEFIEVDDFSDEDKERDRDGGFGSTGR